MVSQLRFFNCRRRQEILLGKAAIKVDNIVVYSVKASKPIAVRYAWADNPVCNLINSEGLPAVPFRTDKLKGITQK